MEKKPKLLLNCCCAPCSSSVLEQLEKDYDITLYFYNPNIFPEAEYNKRAREVKKLIDIVKKHKAVYEKYNHEKFLSGIKGLEQEKEGGLRCHKCYEIRLRKTADYALNNGFEFFTTTLSVSPYKNAEFINEIGEKVEKELQDAVK